ncbi:unnamed protein product [Taenia asiatica]|uniref:Heat shock 70 kDa protein 14 n=1 Tax=Taenia asiatica TaxID=60517 RepID=A0A0R3VY98_TAEAS|nr:unnamed protein product [Taenia asiatica]
MNNKLFFGWSSGSFGVSIMSLDKGEFDEKAFAGDAHLGGEAITSRLVDYVVNVFNGTHEGKDLRTNANAISRLRKECEIAKRSLSVALQSNIELGLVFEGITFSAILTRSRLEQLCRDLFERTMDAVKKALSDAKMEKTDVHEVVLVGESTRIPKVRRMLQEFFEGKEVKRCENAVELTRQGAALLEAKLTGHEPATAQNSKSPNGVPTSTASKPPPTTTATVTEPKAPTMNSPFNGDLGPATAQNSKSPNGVPTSTASKPPPTTTATVTEPKAPTMNSPFNVPTSVLRNQIETLNQEDEKTKCMMTAKTELVSCIQKIKSELESEEVKQKVPEEHRQSLLAMIDRAIKWTATAKEATKEDYDKMRTRFVDVASLLMKKG